MHDKEGGFRGPAYYITKGLNQKWLGIVFATLITVTFAFVFNTVQSNTIAESLNTQYHVSPVITGIILAVITAIIILVVYEALQHYHHSSYLSWQSFT